MMGFSGTSYPHSLCWLLIFKVVGLWGWRNGSAHWCLSQRTWVWFPSLTWHSRLVPSPGFSEIRHAQGTLCTRRHNTHYSDTWNKNESLKMWACFILADLEGSLHIPKGRTLSDTYIANISLILSLSFKKTVVACLTICVSTMTCLWGWEDNLQKWVLFFSLGGRGGGAWGLNAGHQASPQVGVLPAEPYHQPMYCMGFFCRCWLLCF